SRRRHTRFSRDWSSDVCSSDLKHLSAMKPASKVYSPGDIAPLIATTNLQGAVIAMIKLRKIQGLQQHVGEFGERDTFAFTLNPLLDRFLIDHIVDREVLAYIAQKSQHIHLPNPVEIVDHLRRVASTVKVNEAAYLLLQAVGPACHHI